MRRIIPPKGMNSIQRAEEWFFLASAGELIGIAGKPKHFLKLLTLSE
jgi:hypothetical protein